MWVPIADQTVVRDTIVQMIVTVGRCAVAQSCLAVRVKQMAPKATSREPAPAARPPAVQLRRIGRIVLGIVRS